MGISQGRYNWNSLLKKYLDHEKWLEHNPERLERLMSLVKNLEKVEALEV